MAIYSRTEEQSMRSFQKAKGVVLEPLLRLLTALSISANMISFFSAVSAVAGLGAWLGTGETQYFVAGIWIHFLLDGIDGSLARYQKKESVAGARLDLLADTAGVVATGTFLGASGTVSFFIASLFTGGYLAVNAISEILSIQNKQYVFVIRPRVFIYGALLSDLLFATSLTAQVTFLSTILVIIFTITGIATLLKK